jgi:hypothetical protein
MVKILMRVILLTAAFAITAVPAAAQQMEKSSWLPSLITETPNEGFALALTLSRRGVADSAR